MLHKHRITFALPVILILALGLYACVVQENPISGSQRAFAYSWDQEVQIGQQVDEEISAQFGLYDDEQMSAYVTQVGEAVLANSHMRREDTPEMFRETEFTFRVLDSPIINAFALPGGYIYVTRGLMAHLNNEAQLAVVLGHEIGHVAGRHASQRAFNQQLGQIALIGGAIVGQELLGLPGQDILGLGSTAAQLLFLQHSRDHERESDEVGVEYSAKTGYRAHEGSEFFRTLSRIGERTGGGIPNFMSTHPDPGDRERSIIEMSESWAEAGESLEITNQDEFLDIIDGVIVGINPRNGYTDGSTFYHPNGRFQFSVPSDWEYHHEGPQVVLVEQNQQAIMIFQDVENMRDAEDAVDQFGTQEGIQVTQKEAIRINGLPAWLMRAQAQTQEGELELMVFGVQHNNNVYRFVNYAPATEFSRFEGVFNSTIESFSELTDRDRLDVEPARLHSIVADRDDTFESFLPRELPMDMDAQELAIINQVELDERISQGTRLKLPSRQSH